MTPSVEPNEPLMMRDFDIRVHINYPVHSVVVFLAEPCCGRYLIQHLRNVRFVHHYLACDQHTEPIVSSCCVTRTLPNGLKVATRVYVDVDPHDSAVASHATNQTF